MLLFVDGFDHYVTADILTKWTSSNVVTITSGGRAGTNCGFILDETRFFGKTVANSATLIAGGAIKFVGFVSGRNFLSICDASTTQINIQFDGASHMVVQRNGTTLGTTTATFVTGVYYYLELKATIHPSTGTIDLYVDGSNVLSLTGQNTRASANSYANRVIWSSAANGGASIDDVYICDTTGTYNNNVLGDISVITKFADSAGVTTQWTPNTGTNYQAIDDTAPDGDTTYVVSTILNNIDTYNFANIGTVQSVKAVVVSASTKKTGGNAANLALVTRRSGVDYAGSDLPIGQSYSYVTRILEEDPSTTAAWTEAGTDAAEHGIKMR